MIRINLLHSRWQQYLRGIPLPYMGLGLAVLVVLGGLYWADQYYPLHGAWEGLFAAAAQKGAVEVELAVRLERQKVVETERQVPERRVERLARSRQGVGEARETVRQVEAKTASPQKVVRGNKRSGSVGNRRLPRWSPACTQVLEIYKYIPATIQLKLLSGDASGEYSIEGLSHSSEKAFADFRGMLQKFSDLESQPTVRREGKRKNGWVYKFVFRGQLESIETRRLKPISPSEAKSLFHKISVWANQSGLREFTSEGPFQKYLEDSLVNQRQKIWAKGSPQEFIKFIDRLGQVEESATLGELRMVPIYRGGDSWDRARFYAAVDVLVQ